MYPNQLRHAGVVHIRLYVRSGGPTNIYLFSRFRLSNQLHSGPIHADANVQFGWSSDRLDEQSHGFAPAPTYARFSGNLRPARPDNRHDLWKQPDRNPRLQQSLTALPPQSKLFGWNSGQLHQCNSGWQYSRLYLPLQSQCRGQRQHYLDHRERLAKFLPHVHLRCSQSIIFDDRF
jgi:hypothetical protein